MDVSERAAAGEAARSRAPRSSHGELGTAAGRECPVVGVDGLRRGFYVRQLWDGKGSTDVDFALAEFSRL